LPSKAASACAAASPLHRLRIALFAATPAPADGGAGVAVGERGEGGAALMTTRQG
jgi:hypothetical protein